MTADDTPIYDRGRDPAVMAELDSLARRLLADRGADVTAVERGPGWSNATWITSELVVRLEVKRFGADLAREAELIRRLPASAGHPPLVDVGDVDGWAWMITKRVPGRNLGQVWPTLTWDERVRALEQIWSYAQSIHRANDAAAYARATSAFYPSTAEAAYARIARVRDLGALDQQSAEVAHSVLTRFWATVGNAPPVLVHGDLSPVNALWDGTTVTGLLDLEFATLAPVELDLNELLKPAYTPGELGVDDNDRQPSPGRVAAQRLTPDIVAREADPLRGKDLLLGYAVQLELWSVAMELTHGDGAEPASERRAVKVLNRLLDPGGGYLRPVLDRLSPARTPPARRR